MKKLPKISVIIQSHNRPDGLRRALLSLSMQTCQDFEIVISDDTDDPEYTIGAINETWGGTKHNRVNYRHTAPCGAAESMREAFQRSSGEYIKILHDDDWLPPNSLAVTASILDISQDVNAVYGQALISYPQRDKLFYKFSERPVKLTSSEWVAEYAKNGRGLIQSPVCALYRRHDKFRIVWDEYLNSDLREAARKTGAGTDINLQVDNAGSNQGVVLLPHLVAVLCTDMNSTTQTDQNIASYYEMWREEYASNPPWKY